MSLRLNLYKKGAENRVADALSRIDVDCNAVSAPKSFMDCREL